MDYLFIESIQDKLRFKLDVCSILNECRPHCEEHRCVHVCVFWEFPKEFITQGIDLLHGLTFFFCPFLFPMTDSNASVAFLPGSNMVLTKLLTWGYHWSVSVESCSHQRQHSQIFFPNLG